jgi:hypothetical protein
MGQDLLNKDVHDKYLQVAITLAEMKYRYEW